MCVYNTSSPALQVEALIASQANATGFNVSGHTPLDLASEHGHANVSDTMRIVLLSQRVIA